MIATQVSDSMNCLSLATLLALAGSGPLWSSNHPDRGHPLCTAVIVNVLIDNSVHRDLRYSLIVGELQEVEKVQAPDRKGSDLFQAQARVVTHIAGEQSERFNVVLDVSESVTPQCSDGSRWLLLLRQPYASESRLHAWLWGPPLKTEEVPFVAEHVKQIHDDLIRGESLGRVSAAAVAGCMASSSTYLWWDAIRELLHGKFAFPAMNEDEARIVRDAIGDLPFGQRFSLLVRLSRIVDCSKKLSPAHRTIGSSPCTLDM